MLALTYHQDVELEENALKDPHHDFLILHLKVRGMDIGKNIYIPINDKKFEIVRLD